MTNRIDFDDYAAAYEGLSRRNVSFFDRDFAHFAEYKVLLARELSEFRHGRILDFGCGIGQTIPFFHKHFPECGLVGCDRSSRSLQIARERYPFAEFIVPEELPSSMLFELVFASGVFHHVPPGDRAAVAAFCSGRLAKGGRFIIFEHNPYNPITRKLVSSCPFDRDAVLLTRTESAALVESAGLTEVRTGYTLFFPGCLRRLRFLERWMRRVPLGGQYFVMGEWPEPQPSLRVSSKL